MRNRKKRLLTAAIVLLCAVIAAAFIYWYVKGGMVSDNAYAVVLMENNRRTGYVELTGDHIQSAETLMAAVSASDVSLKTPDFQTTGPYLRLDINTPNGAAPSYYLYCCNGTPFIQLGKTGDPHEVSPQNYDEIANLFSKRIPVPSDGQKLYRYGGGKGFSWRLYATDASQAQDFTLYMSHDDRNWDECGDSSQILRGIISEANFIDAQLGLVCFRECAGAAPRIFITRDGGKQWLPLDYQIPDHLQNYSIEAVGTEFEKIRFQFSCLNHVIGTFMMRLDENHLSMMDESMMVTAGNDDLLKVICSSPAAASFPGAYTASHPIEYQHMLSMGNKTLKYIFGEFLKGGQTDLRGLVMAAVGQMLIGHEDIGIDSSNGQNWFDQFRANAERLKTSCGDLELRRQYPCVRLLLSMLDNDGLISYAYSDMTASFSFTCPEDWEYTEDRAWEGTSDREASPDTSVVLTLPNGSTLHLIALLTDGGFPYEYKDRTVVDNPSGIPYVRCMQRTNGDVSVAYLLKADSSLTYYAYINASMDDFNAYQTAIEKTIMSISIDEQN